MLGTACAPVAMGRMAVASSTSSNIAVMTLVAPMDIEL